MTNQEYEYLKTEIVRQMGVKDITEANTKGDWSKADSEIREKYTSYVASCLLQIMKNLR